MNKGSFRRPFGPALLLFALLLAACGGPGLAAPTAIPASVNVPEQPAPIYRGDAMRFTAVTPAPPVFLADAVSPVDVATGLNAAQPLQRPAVNLPYAQTPSAVGVVRGGAALLQTPSGARVGVLPAGAAVTVTGKSADGRAYAVFDHEGAVGWLAADAVTLFGGDDLLVVDDAAGPGPVATLMADALRPIEPSVLEGVGLE